MTNPDRNTCERCRGTGFVVRDRAHDVTPTCPTCNGTGRTDPKAECQRMEALERANAIRSARAELKRRLKSDTRYRLLTLALALDTEALGMPAGYLDSMRVYDLLVAAPKLGHVKVNRALMTLRVSPSKTLAGLTDRQRDELLAAIDGRAAARPAFPTTTTQEA